MKECVYCSEGYCNFCKHRKDGYDLIELEIKFREHVFAMEDDPKWAAMWRQMYVEPLEMERDKSKRRG